MKRDLMQGLTSKEVAFVLGVHESTVSRAIKVGRLPARKGKGCYSISLHDVLAYAVRNFRDLHQVALGLTKLGYTLDWQVLGPQVLSALGLGFLWREDSSN